LITLVILFIDTRYLSLSVPLSIFPFFLVSITVSDFCRFMDLSPFAKDFPPSCSARRLSLGSISLSALLPWVS